MRSADLVIYYTVILSMAAAIVLVEALSHCGGCP